MNALRQRAASSRGDPGADTPNCDKVHDGKVGDHVDMDVKELEAQMRNISWPLQARSAVNGTGTCLGATNDPKGCRLGFYIGKRKYDDFAKLANSSLRAALDKANIHFTWSSLQVNCYCVSNIHKDSNNVGL